MRDEVEVEVMLGTGSRVGVVREVVRARDCEQSKAPAWRLVLAVPKVSWTRRLTQHGRRKKAHAVRHKEETRKSRNLERKRSTWPRLVDILA